MALTDKKPAGLLRALFRAPIWLYRWNLGWIMGKRFLLLTHTGRKSGLPRQAIIEVVSHDEATGVYYIAAAWQDKSDWYLNVRQTPAVGVQVRNYRFEARAEQIPVDGGAAQLWVYAQKYPAIFRGLAMVLLGERLPVNKETCRKVAESVPIISLTPTG